MGGEYEEGEYEIRDGVVLESAPDRVVVRMDKDEDCGGCRSCAVKGLCHGRTASHIDVALRPDGGAPPRKAGERVRVAYRRANPAVAASILFVPTLAGLFAGGMAANGLIGPGDGIFLAGTAAGVIIGLGITYAFGRWSRSLAPKFRLLDAEVL